MPYTLVQAGSNLYSLNAEGAPSAALTLPANITLSNARVPRFARFGNYVILVNTPSRPLTIDSAGIVRVLTPRAPTTPNVLSGAAGGTLTGTFLEKQTYVVLDALGNLISESDYSPISNQVTINGQYLRVASIGLSGDTVTATRLYRTTDNGATFFQWIDVSGNSNTSIQDDTPDAGIGLFAAGARGSAPDLTLIAQWAGRAWGVDRVDIDNLRYTEAEVMSAWPLLNTIPIANVGDDRFGITGFAPRRDALGVGRRNQLTQITGNGADVAFTPTIVSTQLGIISQESVVVFRDTAFFLWMDGVYMWDSNGIRCISDEGDVRSWFATDNYFNRGMFSLAFAVMDMTDTTYRLFLCSPGSTTPDRWVEYNTATGNWFGPHKTDAFTLSCALYVRGTNDQPYAAVGSREGYVSIDTPVRSDWDQTPIDEQVITKQHTGDNPDRNSMYLQPTFQGEAQPSGNLIVTPAVGPRNKLVAGPSQRWDLTQDRQKLFRLGQGRHLQLTLANKELNVNPVIYGYQVPTADVGRR